MPTELAILSLVIQALLIVHVIKTGRNQIWIWVLALLSFAGVIAYLAAELVPELLRSRATQGAVRGMKKMMDPQARLRRLEQEAKVGGNVAANQRYAEELVVQGRAADAIEVYRRVLRGLYEHDPDLMLGLAQAQFANGAPAEARATLDELIARNPQYKSPQGHLLYARALEGEGEAVRALDEYKVLAGYFPGAEAAVRYAQLLQARGQPDEAARVARELLEAARIAPAHYRRTQEDFLKEARRIAGG